jgi:hypothetical protein
MEDAVKDAHYGDEIGQAAQFLSLLVVATPALMPSSSRSMLAAYSYTSSGNA